MGPWVTGMQRHARERPAVRSVDLERESVHSKLMQASTRFEPMTLQRDTLAAGIGVTGENRGSSAMLLSPQPSRARGGPPTGERRAPAIGDCHGAKPTSRLFVCRMRVLCPPRYRRALSSKISAKAIPPPDDTSRIRGLNDSPKGGTRGGSP